MYTKIEPQEMGTVIGSAIKNTASEVSHTYANRLLSLIKAQTTVMNVELASSYKQHGYDFKTIPDSFLENAAVLQVNSADGTRSYKVHIPAESFHGASKTLVDFFDTYVVKNAMNLLKILT